MESTASMANLLLTILMMTLYKPLSAQNPGLRSIDLQVQTQLARIRELAKIKAQILQRLGVSEPPRSPTPPPKPEQRAIDNNDNAKTYKLLHLVSIHSEPSDEFADDKIIQFHLGSLTADKKTVIESVNLLLRIKNKKSLKKSTHELSSDINLNSFTQSLGQSIDGLPLAKHLTKKEKGNLKTVWREKNRGANELPITLIVSNVTESGQPDVILTKFKSTLRKSINVKLSLPINLIKQSFDEKEHTLCLYVQCDGCGKRAMLILNHKLRRRQRHTRKQRSKPRSLHKRRPILFIQSRITAVR
ncbi:uncharacterized protein LOC127856257 [Dreissena polymorpha]|uniref:Uncharacterized protein n=1 Tax=Dreissena polymorpha TaxID=45954 RepID=A0A9D4C356_DREPO|nr:uncharacterized protein LOC127856257 [Dreissena polymorpha]KAH3716296.1 hypothetical protein DPMN_059015 [Dreissena polymorpha]